jgi:PhnB protein
MKRTLMQIYVKGSVEAVEFYQRAFDAKLGYNEKNPEGGYFHAELDVYGQILAISEDSARNLGDAMQFCLHFDKDEKDKVAKAYSVLKNGARKIDHPLGPCVFSPYMASLVDKFGVYWCIFTE